MCLPFDWTSPRARNVWQALEAQAALGRYVRKSQLVKAIRTNAPSLLRRWASKTEGDDRLPAAENAPPRKGLARGPFRGGGCVKRPIPVNENIERGVRNFPSWMHYGVKCRQAAFLIWQSVPRFRSSGYRSGVRGHRFGDFFVMIKFGTEPGGAARGAAEGAKQIFL